MRSNTNLNSAGLDGEAGRRILMVAPQPFFRPRGTPFSVLHRIRALTLMGSQVHLITYPFGEDVEIPGLTIERSARVPGIGDIRIGPSSAKAFLDLPLLMATVRALRRNRYDVLHSHEEAAFFCAPLARMHGVRHIYDMHSSLPQQLANFRAFNFRPIRNLFAALERHVLKTCDGVITICQDLADVAVPEIGNKPHAMIENTADDAAVFGTEAEDVRAVFALGDNPVALYTGTFEPYQGLDLLLRGFATVIKEHTRIRLVLVGGRPEQVDAMRGLARELGVLERCTFVGQVQPGRIPGFVRAADLIVSPRSSGTNTPLKIYGYLRSGKPIVATDLPTHTQTLSCETAELVAPTAEGIATGMLRVLQNPDHARRLTSAARAAADAQYSDAAYLRKVSDFYAAVCASPDRDPRKSLEEEARLHGPRVFGVAE